MLVLMEVKGELETDDPAPELYGGWALKAVWADHLAAVTAIPFSSKRPSLLLYTSTAVVVAQIVTLKSCTFVFFAHLQPCSIDSR